MLLKYVDLNPSKKLKLCIIASFVMILAINVVMETNKKSGFTNDR
jgi:hypothetical protein